MTSTEPLEALARAEHRVAESRRDLAAAIETARGTAPVEAWLAERPDLQRIRQAVDVLPALTKQVSVIEDKLRETVKWYATVYEGLAEAARERRPIAREVRDAIDMLSPRSREIATRQAQSIQDAWDLAGRHAMRGSDVWVSEFSSAVRRASVEITKTLRAINGEQGELGSLPVDLQSGGLRQELEAARDAKAQAEEATSNEDALQRFLDERIEEHVTLESAGSRRALAIALSEVRRAKRHLIQSFEQCLRDGFLSAEPDRFAPAEREDLRSRLHQLRTAFVQQWCRREIEMPVDVEQAEAIATTNRHVLVTARAGSGKTRTLVARTAFLVRHCGVSPEHLLLLAFNRKAAREMAARLKELGCACPHVMTFHALAWALVHPEEGILYDAPDELNSAQSQVVQRVVLDFLDRAEYESMVREFMLAHFRRDWEEILGSGFDLSREEGLRFRRALTSETLGGQFVKSAGERIIANALFERRIPYLYEKSHLWSGRNYRPDFSLDTHGIVIEYFGLAGEPDYDDESRQKREYWSKKIGWRLLEYGPRDLQRGQPEFEELLCRDLREAGVDCTRLTEDEIWNRVRDRSLSRFAVVSKDFIGRCRKAGLSVGDLRKEMRGYKPVDDSERQFLALVTEMYGAYLQRLTDEGQEDFDGLLERACSRVEASETDFNRKSGDGDLRALRFVLVDEFQDFAPLFYRMLTGVQGACVDVQFFCVGDDWQAINGFAGSDLRYFRGFRRLFSPSSGSNITTNITTNYRSAEKIVSFGNQVMSGLGAEARPRDAAPPGEVWVADLSRLKLTFAEQENRGGDRITPAVRRLIRSAVARGERIALLARRNGVPWQVSTEPGARPGLGDLFRLWTRGLARNQLGLVEVTTAHKFKGLEAENVVVLDALERTYPLVHPNWVFTRALGDSIPKIIEAEQRLFYVACTRAVRRLFLVTDSGRQSEFLLSVTPRCDVLDWDLLPSDSDVDSRLIIQVGNREARGSSATYVRRDLLKAHGFAFHHGDWKYWGKSYPRSESLQEVIAQIAREAWMKGPDGLEIRLCRADESVLAKYEVVEGTLRELPLTGLDQDSLRTD